MSDTFDHTTDRRASDSVKWRCYDEDVLPLWVADMDFPSPEPVIEALRRRVDHGVFGYGIEPPELRPLLVERLHRLYAWEVSPEAIVFLPGVVTGVNLACHAFTAAGEGVVVQPPVYPPILGAAAALGRAPREAPLTRGADGHYGIDRAGFEAAMDERTRLFVLCNPHNPVGRVFSRDELLGMADVCLRRDVVICSDEIHCDLIFPPARHLPIASLDPEIAARTITLMAPSKTYNIAGLNCAFAVIPNRALCRRFLAARAGLVGDVNLLGYVAAVAAYRDGQPWLDDVLAYLRRNRDLVAGYVGSHMPGVEVVAPEATYLAWLDCRRTGIADPCAYFRDHARVALNDGCSFGQEGAGFVRLNFGCPRPLLQEALGRMRRALEPVARAEAGGAGGAGL